MCPLFLLLFFFYCMSLDVAKQHQKKKCMGTLARDKSVTPRVACLTDGTLTDGEYPCSLSPSFDSAFQFVRNAVRPTFVFNPLRRISDPSELTIGHPCFSIEGVPLTGLGG